MTGETETKKKVRIKIERDAHPALLSFKGGATPFQVEERIQDLFGLDYSAEYHLAGVENMHQILMEHPEIRQRRDGKFEIIANENNVDLVQLVSKQKDKVVSRSKSCIGHRHKHSPRAYSRLSPKQSRLKRPVTAMTKNHLYKNVSNTSHSFLTNYNKYYMPSTIKNTRTYGNTSRIGVAMSYKSPPPVQRPLVRPKTSTSTFYNQIDSSPVTKKVLVIVNENAESESHSALLSQQMPSIKQFSQNVKRMMTRIYPVLLPVSEMSEQYFKEYNVLIDPSKLFSKTWKILLKTTFKEWLQVNDEYVSLKQAPTKESQAGFENKNTPSEIGLQNTQNADFSQFTSKENVLHDSFTQSISPSEMIIKQMEDLNIGTRKMRTSPEKRPATMKDPFASSMNPIIKFLVGGKTPPMTTTRSYGPFIQMQHCQNSEDTFYDSNTLRKIKKLEVDKCLRAYIASSLNEIPCIKRKRSNVSKGFHHRAAGSPGSYQMSKMSRRTPIDKRSTEIRDFSSLLIDTSPDSNYSNSPSSLSPPDSKPIRMRLNEKPKHNNVESLYMLSSERLSDRRNIAMTRDADCHAKESISTCSSDSIQKNTSTSSIRKMILPPMSKGVLSKPPPRIRSDSYVQTTASSSVSSMNSRIIEMRGGTADDDIW